MASSSTGKPDRSLISVGKPDIIDVESMKTISAAKPDIPFVVIFYNIGWETLDLTN